MPLFYMGLHPMPCFLLWGGVPMPLFLWDYASHTRTDFSYTRKVSKSVCKGVPLQNPEGEPTVRLVCLRHTQPWFPRSDLRSRSPFALRVVSSSARGDVPFRALWGKSTPRSGDVPPRGDFQEDPSS